MKRLFLLFFTILGMLLWLAACDTSQTNGDNGATEVEAEADMENDGTATPTGDNPTAEIENTDLVPSGIYDGTAQRVDPTQNEVYMQTDGGELIELYFSDQTRIIKNGEMVPFDAMEEGQRIQVEVKRQGDHLEPITVNILGI
ncbi:MAG: hypothetical protein HC880_08945 [Bacteroidia bacterium]|nr:hypothetical protein [Bacteroidia bacterium]